MNANQCDIGLIGLGVMGENLALNIESKGFSVAVFNRTMEVTEKFAADRAKIRYSANLLILRTSQNLFLHQNVLIAGKAKTLRANAGQLAATRGSPCLYTRQADEALRVRLCPAKSADRTASAGRT